MMPPLVIFDLDGTLAESKQPLSFEMAEFLDRLLSVTQVAVVSGGAFPQFIKQVVDRLPHGAERKNLFLLPTSGAALYEWTDTGWNKVYEERLSEREAHEIEAAMKAAAAETGVINFSEKSWGERVEYRGGQVSLSALGQEAPLAAKKEWDPSHAKRRLLQENLAERLPNFSVGIGGATTIDVTKRGVDKAYGIRKLCERLHINESDALYVGDELGKGGNDEAVYKTEVKTKSVKHPRETMALIEHLLQAGVNRTRLTHHT